MPRKRTVQPLPIETIPFDGGIVEVYADDAQPIGRGLTRKNKAIARQDKAMVYLADLYFSRKPEDTVMLKRCLRSACHLQKQLELRGMLESSRAVWQSAMKAVKLFKALSPQMKKPPR